ncbi:hypothetical protein MANES_10G103550v8 [Manihot esculenta]|uniref:Uncharacterized protein n=1 Tax=Manihot esculenta TaxID=3983 RepID=A0ACB7H000_MANES|nr:hypothetical protein MANES_10G103550v8 [Manihot esculenta]
MQADIMCPICQQELETVEHALFWCDHARASWFASPCAYKPQVGVIPSISSWWTDIIEEYRQQRIYEEGLIVIIMSDPVQTVEKMKQACCEATGVRDSKISDRSALSNGRQASNDRWMTPLLGWVKINFAVLVRDDKGQIVDGMTKTRRSINTLMREASAILLAHLRRSGNEAANCLAKFVVSNSLPCNCLSNIPRNLLHLCIKDYSFNA